MAYTNSARLKSLAMLSAIAVALVCGYVIGQIKPLQELTWASWIFPGSGTSALEHNEVHAEDAHDHEHEGHDHGSEDPNSLELTEVGRRNLGLTEEYLKSIELANYTRSISVPSIVVDRPGRTKLPVSAPMTGIVTHVHAVAGEAVKAGELILGMRLTHEDLVTLQKEYLQSLGDRDVELKEIDRIQKATESGAISPKTLLERKYSRDKLDSLIRSQREALRLHGLTPEQLDVIDRDRRLLTEVSIIAPGPDSEADDKWNLGDAKRTELSLVSQNVATEKGFLSLSHASTLDHHGQPASTDEHLLVIHELRVQKGQIVDAGDILAMMADYESLLVEGQAFEAEAGLVAKVRAEGKKVLASVGEGDGLRTIGELELVWIENEINPANRTLKFFANLPNRLTADQKIASGQRFIEWEFKPGQRMQLNIPVETWEEQFVLPVDAVVREGFESFVFQQNGDSFERVPVHERFRDGANVVIENDGSIFPGDVIALRGAHQMQMALKNRSGGGADPHAGHNH